MTETARERILTAVCEVLYIAESDLVDGDETDLRDLGLDSVRFTLLMKQLGLSQEAEMQSKLMDNFSIANWVRQLESST
ncbi:hypothetical protein JK2ML_1995 [Mycobacterium leprae Kyoto-2]|uniref:Carrier domain-containing protein n=3 Tax=Mycobacterium leprae TaxID=1769 RepID=Q9CBG2_MYCLE|nr:acyl carrier protein [Mycobacterium leprae]CAR72092.1 conserved hypothetical protein [Mycobacterium leprae Br4923]AWV48393.1 acyl carrier protein [Mycobacterium leprae]OAR20809.1 hypothetical protein A8144_02070 [Mycobacterium leprae 3125609]OAX72012.1 hypothetical protein A3216_02150 [Mycobacterium leprae 7935681]CAC30950.1 conserved hypothetical protein [Mycobacterium leprae]